ncbi:alpha/beta hydrolase [Niabella insulamsoli]|uniref:alpha/beta hydrolase n=1 Tax=Niabella insulamsoli TaxID=3144874 RepID=UPI0031FCD596
MRTLFPLGLALFFSAVVAAQTAYKTVPSIKYYPATAYKSDAYKDSMCVLDLYYPVNKKNFATVVWFHGGGITGGHRDLPKQLTDQGFAVATVEYRLSPHVKAPVYIEDAAAAVAWVFKNIKTYGGNDQLIFLSGHSAGAYLVSMVTLNKNYLARHQVDADKVAALVPFSSQAITHFTVRQERGVDALRPVIDSLAPLYFVRKDAPPTIILTGDRELEMMGRYEENAYWFRMMKLVGHPRTKLFELEGYDHGNMPQGGFPLLIKEIRQRTKEITDASGNGR